MDTGTSDGKSSRARYLIGIGIEARGPVQQTQHLDTVCTRQSVTVTACINHHIMERLGSPWGMKIPGSRKVEADPVGLLRITAFRLHIPGI